MTEPVVDVIVAVHNADRPVERAVASALRTEVPIRVSVVAHNVDPASIRARLGELTDDPRVRVLPLADGVRSPANAFNHGLDAATGRYVSIVGSDDSLEAGALDAWVRIGDAENADAVIAPIVRDGGHGVPSPRIRRSRIRRALDADRDRLFERTAALGLQRRETTEGIRYADGLPRGVDQCYGLALWTSGRVVFDPDAPAYREHADQRDRVTHVFGPLGDDFRYLDLYAELVATLPSALRRAAVSKMMRVHVIPAVRHRAGAGTLTGTDLEAAAAILARLDALAPDARGLLPRSHGPDLVAIDAGSPEAAGRAASRTSSLVAGLLPLHLSLTLHRHAPLRSALAGRTIARRTARGFERRSTRG